MLSIEQVDVNNKAQVKRFLDIPYRMYANCPQWVPPIRSDIAMMLNPKKHPFYEHSIADFFIAVKDGKDVGRIAAMENRPFNRYHQTKQAQFYLFECEDDQEVANALFERVFDWARQHGLDTVVGPKGFGPMDGYGIQVEGTQYRQMMSMMNYNYDYYPRLVETLGFTKEVDFVSHFIDMRNFQFPERIHRIAERVSRRGKLRVKQFESKGELKRWAKQIGKAYNNTFVNNWEYYPLSEREIEYVLDTLIMVAHPKLIKVVLHNEEEIVGFLFGFQDVSAAMQRIKGKLFPFGIIDLYLELNRTEWVSFNGVGILPEYHGLGGNALLYSEMAKTMEEFKFKYAELTQVAETARTMRSDLENIVGNAYKNHRVYIKHL